MSSFQYSVCSLSPELLKKYQFFARKNFKNRGYQFNYNYLKHLYFENPFSNGMDDCRIVAKKYANREEVVGCIHNISSILNPSNNIDKKIKFSGIHNLMIDKDNLGVGYKLLNDAIKRHKNFFVPGVVGDLNLFYSKIGAKQISNKWFRKFIFTNFYQSFQRATGKKISSPLLKKLKKECLSVGIEFHDEPSVHLSNIISKELDCIKYPRLPIDYILWRVFGYRNPDKQTFILTMDNDYVVFSVGCRKNLPILRIIYINFQISKNIKDLIGAMIKIGKLSGSIGIFAASDHLIAINEMNSYGFKELKNAPKSYFYSKEYNNFYSPHWPMMGDYGFDEFFKVE